MDEAQSKWQTPEVATAFLQGVRGAIPGANLQLEVLSKIVRSWCPQPSRILDLGCGDGALGRVLLNEFPSARVIFADFSQPMLEALGQKLGSAERATIIKSDFATPAWAQILKRDGPLDVVVSGFAIHHQSDQRKQEIYAEIYQLLTSSGVFLNLEHVASLTPAGERLFDSFFVDHLYGFHSQLKTHKTRREIEQTYYDRPDKKENILAPVDIQCQWLRQIGFKDVDCFFKVFELALFGGRKISCPADAGQ
jgi:ubiquinone/menaquinone biosynthesis C-methylase UbiE